MKKFREIVQESPVGKVGRTKKSEALEHIESQSIEKKFKKIVKELGGKTATRLLLARMDQNGEYVGIKESTSPQSYLREIGFKLKSEEPTKNGFNLTFFNNKSADNAFENLKSSGFMNDYNINLEGKIIKYSKL